MQGILDFPCDAVFAAPTALGFEVILLRFTNSDVKPVTVNTCSALEWYVLEQAVRGDWERSIRGRIQVATGCMVAAFSSQKFPSNPSPDTPSRICPPLMLLL